MQALIGVDEYRTSDPRLNLTGRDRTPLPDTRLALISLRTTGTTITYPQGQFWSTCARAGSLLSEPHWEPKSEGSQIAQSRERLAGDAITRIQHTLVRSVLERCGGQLYSLAE